MRIVTKKSKIDGAVLNWIKLTYDEELELANTVMTILSTRWVDEDYRRAAHKIYNRKCKGKDITGEYLESLYDKLLFWNDFYEGKVSELIPIPTIGETEKFLVPVPNMKGEVPHGDDLAKWRMNEVSRAWREMWDVHHKDMAAISDAFICFPGDTESIKKHQDMLAIKFWEAVNDSQGKFGISRTQAIKEVADHTPRGSLDIDDPTPHQISKGSLIIEDEEPVLADDDNDDDFIIE